MPFQCEFFSKSFSSHHCRPESPTIPGQFHCHSPRADPWLEIGSGPGHLMFSYRLSAAVSVSPSPSPLGIILSLGRLLQLPTLEFGFAYVTRRADLISPDSRAASCGKVSGSFGQQCDANYRSGATAVIAAIIAASGFVCHIIYPPVMSRLNCSVFAATGWPSARLGHATPVVSDLRSQIADLRSWVSHSGSISSGPNWSGNCSCSCNLHV